MNVTVVIQDTATGEVRGEVFWITDDHQPDVPAIRAAIERGDFDIPEDRAAYLRRGAGSGAARPVAGALAVFPYEAWIGDEFEMISTGVLEAPGKLGSQPFEIVCAGAYEVPIYWRVIHYRAPLISVEFRFNDLLEGKALLNSLPSGRCIIHQAVRPDLKVNILYTS